VPVPVIAADRGSTGVTGPGAAPRRAKTSAPEPKTSATEAMAIHSVTPGPASRASSSATAGTDAIESTVE
jgi:hypothetical protein